MQITLQLFGPFRSLGEQMVVDVPEGACTADLRAPLKALEGVNPALVEVSHFATETALLPDDAPLQHGITLAVIPPVSGG